GDASVILSRPTRRSSDLSQGFGSLFGAAVVFEHQGRTADADLTQFADSDLVAIEVLELDVDHEIWLPDGTVDLWIEHVFGQQARSEEHTSELQSRFDLVC